MGWLAMLCLLSAPTGTGFADAIGELRGSAAPAAVPAVGRVRELPRTASMSLPGGFTLEYQASSKHAKWEAILRGMRALDNGVSRLNSLFSIDPVIAVVARDCGSSNAFYGEGKIEFCYEYLKEATMRLSAHVTPEQVKGEIALTFHHEVGHALIDRLELPVTGNEEDAVDEFAALMLLASGEDGAAEVAALNFRLSSKEARPNLRDEHSPDIRRADATYCLIYGKDPKRFAYLVGKQLPKGRAKGCPAIYQSRRQAWNALLAPHLKERL